MSGPGAAQTAKEKGNAAFKTGDYVGAIGHYTDAALADRLEPTYPLNRAAAYLKLGKNADAERDCSTSLALSPGNVKALFRRAQARLALRKLDEAEKDLNEALKREPANDAIKQELGKLKEIRAQARAPKKAPVSVTTPLPGSTASVSTTSPARRRIPITIDRDYDIKEELPASDSQTASTSRAAPDLLTPVSSRSLTKTESAGPPPKSILKPSPPAPAPVDTPTRTFREVREVRDQLRKPLVGGGIFRQNGAHELFKNSAGDTLAQAHAQAAPSAQPSQPELRSQLSQPVSLDKAKPITLFALQREWTNRSTAEARWVLLCTVPPSSLPAICKNLLEPAFLVALLETFRELATHESVQNAMREYMVHLSKVSRFDTVVMFLSARERDIARDVLRALGIQSWAGISA